MRLTQPPLQRRFVSIETYSAPALTRGYPRSFTFYVGNPFPRFAVDKLHRTSNEGTLRVLAMLTVSQLSKSFAGRALFDDVSLQVNCGDRIGLIGPNGAGKSTLFEKVLQPKQPIPPDAEEAIGALA